eukprot:3933990-Rhodomonas_salina.4
MEQRERCTYWRSVCCYALCGTGIAYAVMRCAVGERPCAMRLRACYAVSSTEVLLAYARATQCPILS